MSNRPAALLKYWNAVAELGCVVCGGPAEIAHCHNGSVRERMQEPKAKGKKLARWDWLVLPLCPWHGRDTSPVGLDRDVVRWEGEYGPQVEHIDRISKQLGVDVWTNAKRGAK